MCGQRRLARGDDVRRFRYTAPCRHLVSCRVPCSATWIAVRAYLRNLSILRCASPAASARRKKRYWISNGPSIIFHCGDHNGPLIKRIIEMIIGSRPLTPNTRESNLEKWPNSYVILPFSLATTCGVELIDFREIIAYFSHRCTRRFEFHFICFSVAFQVVLNRSDRNSRRILLINSLEEDFCSFLFFFF